MQNRFSGRRVIPSKALYDRNCFIFSCGQPEGISRDVDNGSACESDLAKERQMQENN